MDNYPAPGIPLCRFLLLARRPSASLAGRRARCPVPSFLAYLSSPRCSTASLKARLLLLRLARCAQRARAMPSLTPCHLVCCALLPGALFFARSVTPLASLRSGKCRAFANLVQIDRHSAFHSAGVVTSTVPHIILLPCTLL